MIYKFSFSANNKTEMIKTIKEKISLLVDNEPEDPLKYVSYETTITDNTSGELYSVEVTARVKDDNR